jgi:hypothetical protein
MATPERRLKTKLSDDFQKRFPDNSWYTSIRSGIGGQKAGMPDQVFKPHGGRTTWIESKVLPRKVTALQRRQLIRMRNAGMRVLVLTADPKTGLMTLEKVLNDGAPWLRVWEGQGFSDAFWKAASC